MALSTGSGAGAALAEINVTPLVDVMLVLLIVFMVTAPMLQTGVDVDLPQANAQTMPDDSGKLIVTVTKDKRVFIGKSQLKGDKDANWTMDSNWADIEKALGANAKIKIDREVYLHADKNLVYGDVVKLMAALKIAGADKLGMITDPLE
jgi:biopolymer transport protein TolR